MFPQDYPTGNTYMAVFLDQKAVCLHKITISPYTCSLGHYKKTAPCLTQAERVLWEPVGRADVGGHDWLHGRAHRDLQFQRGPARQYVPDPAQGPWEGVSDGVLHRREYRHGL